MVLITVYSSWSIFGKKYYTNITRGVMAPMGFVMKTLEGGNFNNLKKEVLEKSQDMGISFIEGLEESFLQKMTENIFWVMNMGITLGKKGVHLFF